MGGKQPQIKKLSLLTQALQLNDRAEFAYSYFE